MNVILSQLQIRSAASHLKLILQTTIGVDAAKLAQQIGIVKKTQVIMELLAFI